MRGFLEDLEAVEGGGSPESRLTPLIDVVFQLLVFFILTSTFANPALDIVLPQLAGETEAETVEAWRVELDAAGNLAVEGERIAVEDLDGVVRALVAGSPGRDAVVVAADAAVAHGRVLEVMQVLGEAGLRNLLFEHEREAVE
jgi:biopolymer transport protein ExbD